MPWYPFRRAHLRRDRLVRAGAAIVAMSVVALIPLGAVGIVIGSR